MPAQSVKSGANIFWITLLSSLVAGIALGIFGVYYFHTDVNNVSSSGESADLRADLSRVTARGRIKPRDGILSLGVPTPDRIRQIKVKEGQRVEEEGAACWSRQRSPSRAGIGSGRSSVPAGQATSPRHHRQRHGSDPRCGDSPRSSPGAGAYRDQGAKSKIEFLKDQEKNRGRTTSVLSRSAIPSPIRKRRNRNWRAGKSQRSGSLRKAS